MKTAEACGILLIFLCGSMVGGIIAIGTNSKKQSPIFHYMDNVVVTDGFFKGQKGTVKDFNVSLGQIKYLVSRENGANFVDEEDLERIE